MRVSFPAFPVSQQNDFHEYCIPPQFSAQDAHPALDSNHFPIFVRQTRHESLVFHKLCQGYGKTFVTGHWSRMFDSTYLFYCILLQKNLQSNFK